jgi:alpha-1,3-rhamnosyl/mannosyltransferase
LRRRLALPERYALYLGSNKPHKNLPRLIEAWARVRRSEVGTRHTHHATRNNSKSKIRNPKLLIAGAWDERYPEAKHLAESLYVTDSVHFLGPIPNADLPILYAGAELFIFPSLYEGFGLPVLEAMACGTPVACSNASSLPEVTGDAALLFDPTDVATMAAAMQQMLGDQTLRRELSEKGRAQAARFSWERTAQEALAAYRVAQRTR